MNISSSWAESMVGYNAAETLVSLHKYISQTPTLPCIQHNHYHLNSRYQLTSFKYKEYALLSLAVACVDGVPSSDLWSKLTQLSGCAVWHTQMCEKRGVEPLSLPALTSPPQIASALGVLVEWLTVAATMRDQEEEDLNRSVVVFFFFW